LRSTAIVAQLHQLLAIASALLVLLVGLEAAWRAVHRSLPGLHVAQLEGLLTIVLVVAAAGGLGLLVGGARPRELLHFVYGVIAIGAIPIADSLTRQADPRPRAIATLIGALVSLVVILRLFGTG
jgi:hypothetical protein